MSRRRATANAIPQHQVQGERSTRRALIECSARRDVDDLLERGPGAKAVEPGLEVRLRGTLDRQAHPELHVAGKGDVTHGEAVSGKILPAGERGLGNREEPYAGFARRLDRVQVALLGRR